MNDTFFTSFNPDLYRRRNLGEGPCLDCLYFDIVYDSVPYQETHVWRSTRVCNCHDLHRCPLAEQYAIAFVDQYVYCDSAECIDDIEPPESEELTEFRKAVEFLREKRQLSPIRT